LQKKAGQANKREAIKPAREQRSCLGNITVAVLTHKVTSARSTVGGISRRREERGRDCRTLSEGRRRGREIKRLIERIGR